MEGYQDIFIIVGACGIILLLLAVKQNSRVIMNLVFRGLWGTVLIFGINTLCEMAGYEGVYVELNPVTVLTTAILGFPGVILLFGMRIYGLL